MVNVVGNYVLYKTYNNWTNITVCRLWYVYISDSESAIFLCEHFLSTLQVFMNMYSITSLTIRLTSHLFSSVFSPQNLFHSFADFFANKTVHNRVNGTIHMTQKQREL